MRRLPANLFLEGAEDMMAEDVFVIAKASVDQAIERKARAVEAVVEARAVMAEIEKNYAELVPPPVKLGTVVGFLEKNWPAITAAATAAGVPIFAADPGAFKGAIAAIKALLGIG